MVCFETGLELHSDLQQLKPKGHDYINPVSFHSLHYLRTFNNLIQLELNLKICLIAF